MQDPKSARVKHGWRQSALLLLVIASAMLSALAGSKPSAASYVVLGLCLLVTAWALRKIGRLDDGGRAWSAPGAPSRKFNAVALGCVLLGQLYLFYAAGH